MPGRPPKRRSRPDIKDRSTWPTRGEVARQLGISIPTVIRAEGKQFFPYIDSYGVHRYDPVEINAFGKKTKVRRLLMRRTPTTGQIHAAISKMLSRGCTRPEIVMTLQVEYDEVQRVWEEMQIESCREADRLKRQHEEEERLREEERRQQEEFDRRMKEIQENNARLVAAATGTRPSKVR
jgi:hypothetical protein